MGLLRISMCLSLPLLKTDRLLGQGSQLGHPLLCGSELGTHIFALSGLLGEAVPFHLLLMEEP